MAGTRRTIALRAEERPLAGKVAGALWLCVVPMLGVALLLPGTDTEHWRLVLLMTTPALLWGAACLFVMPWERLENPLVFHVPAALALPYIGLLVSLTGTVHSPFGLSALMLLSFCAYFFPPRAALVYLLGCLVVLALPFAYDRSAVDGGLPAQLWVALFVYTAVGGVILVGKHQLMALRHAAEELSLRDSLTGLSNRRALTDALDAHQGGTRRRDAMGLLLIDLDDFKEANTHYGLPGGDRVLCAVAGALQSVSRGEDLLVRLGGDEFAIVARDINQQDMDSLSERALEATRSAVDQLEMNGLELTASAGWALYPDDAASVDELMIVADLALRGAKLNGKNRAQPAVRWSPQETSARAGFLS